MVCNHIKNYRFSNFRVDPIALFTCKNYFIFFNLRSEITCTCDWTNIIKFFSYWFWLGKERSSEFCSFCAIKGRYEISNRNKYFFRSRALDTTQKSRSTRDSIDFVLHDFQVPWIEVLKHIWMNRVTFYHVTRETLWWSNLKIEISKSISLICNKCTLNFYILFLILI